LVENNVDNNNENKNNQLKIKRESTIISNKKIDLTFELKNHSDTL